MSAWVPGTVGAGEDRGVVARGATGYGSALSSAGADAPLAGFGALWGSRAPASVQSGARAGRRRPRAQHWRLDHLDSCGAEDLVEVAGELAVAITDHKPRLDTLVVDVHEQVARLLGHPCAVGLRRDPGEVHATSRQLNEKQDVEPPQEDRVDGQEIALEDACRLLTKELRPTRLKPLGCRFDPCLAQDRPDRA